MTDKRVQAFQLIMLCDHLSDKKFAVATRKIIKNWLDDRRENRSSGIARGIEKRGRREEKELEDYVSGDGL